MRVSFWATQLFYKLFVYPFRLNCMIDGEIAGDLKVSVNRSGVYTVHCRTHNAEGSRDDWTRLQRQQISLGMPASAPPL